MNFRQATGRRAVRVMTAGLTAAWLSVVPSSALAQQGASARPPRVYAGAAGLFTTHPGTSVFAPLPGTFHEVGRDEPIEGNGLTFSGMFGVDLAEPSPSVPPAAAPAEATRLRGYLGGFAGLIVQPVGDVDGHYLTEGVGGSGLGLGGTAGAFIARHWSLAAEVAVGPGFEAQSTFAGRIRFDTRYRDTLISALARWHPMPSAPVQLEPVFGGTVAAGHAPRTQRWINWSGGEEEPTDATITRISFGAVGGADVVAGTGPLVAVASFRLHVLDRNDRRNDQPPELGIGSFVYVIAGGLRWTF